MAIDKTIAQQIEDLQRSSIGNSDPDDRARISRELAALDILDMGYVGASDIPWSSVEGVPVKKK